jgi:exodeoxyribonuclease VII small subunit
MTDATEAPLDAPIESLSFDDALAALQRTVSELESGGLALERSIALYERGVALHERCAKLLAEAELKVQQLVSRAGGALETIDVRPEEPGDGE